VSIWNAPALRKTGWLVEEDQDRDHFVIWTVVHPKKIAIDLRKVRKVAETADSADIKYGRSQDAQAPTNGQLPLEPCPFCDRPVAQPNECCSASPYHGQTNRQEEIHL
jgi:hypothetical protein